MKKRIDSAKQQESQPNQLYPFVGNPHQAMPEGLPFKLTDYLELVELTGRVVRDDKRGAISFSLLPILKRLNIPSADWLDIATSCKRFANNSRANSFGREPHQIYQRC